MDSNKILILGITHPQIDAILYFKKQGFKVHGLSWQKEGMALPFIDHFEQINITDIKSVLDYTKKNNFDLVYSTGSDLAMPAIAEVSEKFGLPFDFDYDQVQMFINKGNFRRFLNTNNLRPVKYKTGSKLQDFESWDKFPAIIKPVDSQGQRGVRKITGRSELIKYFFKDAAHPGFKKVIIEEFLNGSEFNILVFVYRGVALFTFISDRILVEESMPEIISSDMPVGVVKKHIIPSVIPPKYQEKIGEFVKNFIMISGVKNGCIYMQGKYNDGEFNLIEAAPRFDGGHIWKIIKYRYGIDLLGLNIDRLLGKITSEKQIPVISEQIDKRYQIEFFHQRPGEAFNIPDGFDQGACLEFQFYYEPGEIVRDSNGWFEKTGYHIKEI